MKKTSLLIALCSVVVLAGCAQQVAPQEPVDVKARAKVSASGEVFLLDIVASHTDASSCWTVISGSVYDLTSFIGKHPGGDKAILASCGKDSTAQFDGKHGMDPKKWEGLKRFEVMVR